MTATPLHRRIALAAAAAGLGVLVWRISEAAAAAAPVLLVASGVGLGAFIVGSILLAGAVMQARAGAPEMLSTEVARNVLTRALYAAIASTVIAAGAAVLVVTGFSGPAAPIDLILAFGAAGFLLVFAHGHAGLTRA
ncbi:MAG: hypothetical protein ACOC20_03000 [Oceanicaulis sp.]